MYSVLCVCVCVSVCVCGLKCVCRFSADPALIKANKAVSDGRAVTPLQSLHSTTWMPLLALLGRAEGNRAPYTHIHTHTHTHTHTHRHTHKQGGSIACDEERSPQRERGECVESVRECERGLKEFRDVKCGLLLLLAAVCDLCGEGVWIPASFYAKEGMTDRLSDEWLFWRFLLM